MSPERILRIERRIVETRAWLKEHAPLVDQEQKHLDAGTEARAYWHYGYLCALRDALSERGETEGT